VSKTGYIEVKIEGTKGNAPLEPDTYDIKELRDLLDEIEALVYPTRRPNDHLISHKVEKGSVKHFFTTALLAVLSLQDSFELVQNNDGVLDSLPLRAANAILHLQTESKSKGYIYTITTSKENSKPLRIDGNSNYRISDDIWVDTELYLYGQVTDIGGKKNANIHLETVDHGSVAINADKDVLKDIKDNLLYKTCAIRTTAIQNINTQEIKKGSLNLISLLPPQQELDINYLDKLIERASESWAEVNDSDEWLNKLRGYD
jgi:hypothetical protein